MRKSSTRQISSLRFDQGVKMLIRDLHSQGCTGNLNAYIDLIDLSSRRKRRAAAKLAVRLIDMIHLAEFQYLQKIPFNLRSSGAYCAADDALDWLVAAMQYIGYAYD